MKSTLAVRRRKTFFMKESKLFEIFTLDRQVVLKYIFQSIFSILNALIGIMSDVLYHLCCTKRVIRIIEYVPIEV